MAVLEVRNLVKAFAGVRAVNGISFSVDAGEVLVIVGGSGCGKTTTLRCIAGLEEVTDGTISLEGRVIASAKHSVPPERRGIGMVFQSYALWPHKTVAQNVAYGLQKRGGTSDTRAAVAQALAQVGLAGFEERYPSTLSGGQQQRVALARSAVVNPKLLLLDEPLSNLDAKLRERMREDLGDMIRQLGMTAVHITHDQSEAMALADRVVCMRDGHIEQIGTPRAIYRRPKTRFVADFLGSCSFVEGRVAALAGAGRVRVQVSDTLTLEASCDDNLTVGSPTILAIRPEAVSVAAASGAGSIAGVVRGETFLGDRTEYKVELAGLVLKASSSADLGIGQPCAVTIDAERVICLPS